jgi:hypothetical protein
MARNSKLRAREVAAAAAAGTFVAGIGAHMLIKEFDSADTLLSHCTVAKLPNAADDYQQAKAERLLGVNPARAPHIEYFGAVCLTVIDRQHLENGVDIGPYSFGPGEPYQLYDNCVVFTPDKQVMPSDGLKQTQLVIACNGLHAALDA